MNKELMDILIKLTELIADMNRAVECSNRKLGIDSADTDAIFDNVASLQIKIYNAASWGGE